ncbi:hypothetical protein Agub_g6714 [Astrephomene gubernaculifera]|uniref:Protein kinase domain-containing protein n=1 Tax=Astrephomene gubernaculifera TaxID=47775 RepID=A0AAD3DNW1_9CHLO|nr:hypothetical protein Agub_g6714 [Astrephomene gubernaculifera]
MEQLWEVVQAQEAARLEVQQLAEVAARSKVHKQRCQEVAEASQHAFIQLETALRQRTSDHVTLLSSAARLTAAAKRARSCVEEVGNPSAIGRLTVSFQRKAAERALSDERRVFLELVFDQASTSAAAAAAAASGSITPGNASLRMSNLGAPTYPLQPSSTMSSHLQPAISGRFKGSMRGIGGSAFGQNGLRAAMLAAGGSSMPVTLSSQWASNMDSSLSVPPDFVGGAHGQLARLGTLNTTAAMSAGGAGSGLLPYPMGSMARRRPSSEGAAPCSLGGAGSAGGAGMDEADAARSSLPFLPGSVRSSDGLGVQKLCFMRGASGEKAAVQLLVVVHKQVEVYSSALDSFHSVSQVESDGQQVTSTTMYEPTIDLITGHKSGSVLVYGRPAGAPLSTGNGNGASPRAASAATAAALAGFPLIIRLSRFPVTALHAVPGVELDAATIAAAAAASPVSTGGAAQVSAGGAPAVAAGSNLITSGSVDDVLLYTGDAAGRVMAIRYNRTTPDLTAATVFTAAKRTASGRNLGPSSLDPFSTAITGLLYRGSYLVVCTANHNLHAIKVLSASPPPSTTTSFDIATARSVIGSPRAGEAPGGGLHGADSLANPTTPGAGSSAAPGTPGAGLPVTSSVNLLTPAGSTLSRAGTLAHGNGSVLAPGGGGSGSGGGAQEGATGTTIGTIRKGPLGLTTAVVDIYSFAVYGDCTEMVSIDWGSNAANGSMDGAIPGADAAGASEEGDGGFGPYPNFFGTSPAAGTGSMMRGAWMTDGGASAANNGRRSRTLTARRGPWRMLTSHQNGQLLMWDLAAGRLQLICTIGETGSSIVSVKVFPDLGTMVEILSSGFLRVGQLPTSALAPPLNPLGGVPAWRLRQALIRAHRGRITSTSTLAHVLATGTKKGGVKVWDVSELRSKAAVQGVAFKTPLTSAGSEGVAAAAAVGGAVSAVGGPADPVPMQAAASSRYPFGMFASAGGGAGAPGSVASGDDRYPLGPGNPSLSAMPNAPTMSRQGTMAGPPGSAYPSFLQSSFQPPQSLSRIDSDRGSVASGSICGLTPPGPMPLAPPPPAQTATPLPHPDAGQMRVPGPDTHQGFPGVQRVSAGGALGAGANGPAPMPFGTAAVLDSPADSIRAPIPARYPNSTGGVAPSEDDGAGTIGTNDLASEKSSIGASALAALAGVLNGGAAPVAKGTTQQPQLQRNMTMPPLQHPHQLEAHQKQEGNLTALSPPSPRPQSPGNGQQSQQAGALKTAGDGNNRTSQEERPARGTNPGTKPATTFASALEGEILHALAAAGGGGTKMAAQEEKRADESNKLPVVLPAGLTAAEAEESAKADPRTRWGNAGAAIMQANRQSIFKRVKGGSKSSDDDGPSGGNNGPSGSAAAVPTTAAPPPPVVSPSKRYTSGAGAPPPPPQQPPPAAYGAAQYPHMPDGYMIPRAHGNGASPYSTTPPSPPPRSLSFPHQGVPYSNGHSLMDPPPTANSPYNSTYLQPPHSPRGAPPSPYGAQYVPTGSQFGRGQSNHGNAHHGHNATSSHGYGHMSYPPPALGRTSDYGGGGISGLPPSPAGAGGMGPLGNHHHHNMHHSHGQMPGVQQQVQHVPGPRERRLSTMSDYEVMASRRTSGSGHEPLPLGQDVEMLPVPPVLPPPAPVPNTTAQSPPQAHAINPLLQNCFIRPDDLRLIDPVGQGAEGTVWRGRWHHIDVAVKEMHPTSASFGKLVSIAKDLSSPESARSSEVLAGVVKEVSALMDLGQHPNIIRFVGVCAEPPRIVTEYYKMGSLYHLLKEARQGNMRTREKLTWAKRLIMLQDMAAGMSYLHSRNYIHGDLRSPNVFVSEDQHLKIGDFGFARILGTAQNPVQEVPARLTNPRWQAPEVYAMNNPTATTAADVYSFGIIMYEMLTYTQPYNDVADDEMVMCRHSLSPEWRPTLPPDSKLPVPPNVHLQAYKALMQDCWAVDPADRPAFHKIAERLMALIRWQRTLSQVRNSLLGARLFKNMTARRTANAAAIEAASAAAAALPGGASATMPASPRTGGSAPAGPTTAATTIAAASAGASSAPAAAASPPVRQQEPADEEADRDLVPELRSSRQLLASVAAAAFATPTPTAAAAAAVAGFGGASAFSGAVEPISPPSPVTGSDLAGSSSADGGGAFSARTSVSFGSRLSSRVSGWPPATSGSGMLGAHSSLAAQQLAAAATMSAELESVPTLASTASRPLRVTAATRAPSPPPPPAAAAAPVPVAPAAPAAPLGALSDGFALMSPFQALNLSDDEDDAAPVVPEKVKPASAATAAAAAPAVAAAPAAAAKGAGGPIQGSMSDAPVAAVAVVMAGAGEAAVTALSEPPATLAAVAPRPNGAAAAAADPFAMESPFLGLGSLDSDDSVDGSSKHASQGEQPCTKAGGPASQAATAVVAVVAAVPPAAAAGPPRPSGGDPFAMMSPFQGLGLDDDDE